MTDDNTAEAVPGADMDALMGKPLGYSAAIQWLFLGVSTPQELLAAADKIEADLWSKQAGVLQGTLEAVAAQSNAPGPRRLDARPRVRYRKRRTFVPPGSTSRS
jgi:hypothetical protein